MKGFAKVPTVFDLLKPASYQYLKSLFTKFDIQIDPKILILKNQSKETILQKILSDLDSAPKMINVSREFHHITDNEVVEVLSQEKNLKDLRIFNIIHCLLLNALMEKALAYFVHKKKMKEIRKALHEILVKIASADYARQLMISEAERMRIQELNAKVSQMMLEEMKLFYQTTFHQLSEIHQDIVKCNDRIIRVKEEKRELKKMLNKESIEIAHKIIAGYHDRKTKANPFEKVNAELLGEVIDQFQNQMGKAEWELEVLDEKDKEDSLIEKKACEREALLNDQLKNLSVKEIEMKYASKSFLSLKPMVRISGAEKKMIEDERRIIEDELIEIKEMRELRNKKTQDREVAREKIQYSFSDILANIIKEKNDPTLNNILSDAMAMNYLSMSASLKIGEIVEDYKRKNKEIYVVNKEKEAHLNRADQYIQNNEKLIENYRALPFHQEMDAMILQREKTTALYNQIHETAIKTLSPTQLKQKEDEISKRKDKIRM